MVSVPAMMEPEEEDSDFADDDYNSSVCQKRHSEEEMLALALKESMMTLLESRPLGKRAILQGSAP